MTSSTITYHDLLKLEGNVTAPNPGDVYAGPKFRGRWVLREDVMVLLVEDRVDTTDKTSRL